MGAQLKALKSPLDVYNAETYFIEANQTLDDLFSKLVSNYSAPCDHVLCTLNGDEIPAHKWSSTYICDGDSVIVCQRVHGLESIAINLLISIALSAISYFLTSVPEVDKVGEIPDASPTYDIDAQGNKARLGKAIPVRYGRHRVYPDFASSPYREYEGKDQFLYQLFAIGQGEYNYYDLKIGDTPIANFDEVTYEFYAPGQKVTLFRDAVNTSPDVTNTTLFAPNEPEYVGFSGPYTANDVGTTVEELAVDFVIPGLYFSDDKGRLVARSVRVLVEYRDIDDNDVPVGDWVQFTDKTYTAATVDTLRRTIRKSITTTTGRVQVQARRVNSTSDDYKERDEISWTGLKAYLESDQTYDHSVWAVKVKATDNLSSQNERLFNLVPFRKLPIWTGTEWTALQETRNLVWAYCDALKSSYGGDYTDSNLKLDELKTLADEYDARQDYFDGSFDTKTTLWVALKKMCLAGRAEPIQYGETFSIVRDGQQTRNTYMFNGRNTVAGSMETQYLTVDQFADDSVEIEYIDEDTWTTETVLCSVPGSAAQKPKQVKLFGCVNRIQAMREGTFMAAKQEYRNRVTSFKTELDGRNIRYLDNLIVAQDLHKWGQGGEVVAVDNQTLILSEPVDFDESGTHQIYLRTDTGLSSGPYTASGVSGDEVAIIETMPAWVYAGDQKEKTYFIFVTPTNQPRQMLSQNIKSSGETTVTIEAVIDDPRVHSFDDLINNGTIIVPPAAQPRPYAPFVISNLIILQVGTVDAPQLQMYWEPVSDAKRYVVDVSYDAGESWTRLTTVESSSALISVRPGTVDVRIAPQNDETGQWYQQQVEIGSAFAVPPTPTGLQLTETFTGTAANFTWLTQPTAASWFIEVSDLSGNVRYQENVTDIGFSYRYDQAALHGIGREFDVSLYAVNGNGVKSNPVTLRVKNEQVAKINGVVAVGIADQNVISWPLLELPDLKAIQIHASQTQGFTPDTTTIIEPNATALQISIPGEYGETWYFRVAGVDVWGDDELNFSDEVSSTAREITVTAIADDFIETPMLAAGAVTADKATIYSLSSLSAVLGTVTSGIFKTSNLLGYRTEMSSEGDYPLWYGSGEKNATNGRFYFDKNGNLVAKGLAIYNTNGDLVMSSGGAFSGSIPVASVTGLGSFATLNQIDDPTYIANGIINTAHLGSVTIQWAQIENVSINFADINNVVIQNAHIVNLSTGKLTGRISQHVVSAHDSATVIGTSWVTIASHTLPANSIGQDAEVHISGGIYAPYPVGSGTNASTFEVRIYIGGTLVRTAPIIGNKSGQSFMYSLTAFRSSVGTGNIAISAQARRTGGASHTYNSFGVSLKSTGYGK